MTDGIQCIMDFGGMQVGPHEWMTLVSHCHGAVKYRYVGTQGTSIYTAAFCEFHKP